MASTRHDFFCEGILIKDDTIRIRYSANRRPYATDLPSRPFEPLVHQLNNNMYVPVVARDVRLGIRHSGLREIVIGRKDDVVAFAVFVEEDQLRSAKSG